MLCFLARRNKAKVLLTTLALCKIYKKASSVVTTMPGFLAGWWWNLQLLLPSARMATTTSTKNFFAWKSTVLPSAPHTVNKSRPTHLKCIDVSSIQRHVRLPHFLNNMHSCKGFIRDARHYETSYPYPSGCIHLVQREITLVCASLLLGNHQHFCRYFPHKKTRCYALNNNI